MYLLEGGFKKFWETHPELCEPRNYVEMKDTRFVKDLRAMRSNSKVKRRYFSRSCSDVFAARADDSDDDDDKEAEKQQQPEPHISMSEALRKSSRM